MNIERALSYRQPWGFLTAAGYKPVENRSWKIGRNQQYGSYQCQRADFDLVLPARIYIHASKSKADMTPEIYEWICERLADNPAHLIHFKTEYDKLDYGAIIGEVDITACVTYHPSPFFTGKYGLVQERALLYDIPIPCRGALGFFKPEI